LVNAPSVPQECPQNLLGLLELILGLHKRFQSPSHSLQGFASEFRGEGFFTSFLDSFPRHGQGFTEKPNPLVADFLKFFLDLCQLIAELVQFPFQLRGFPLKLLRRFAEAAEAGLFQHFLGLSEPLRNLVPLFGELAQLHPQGVFAGAELSQVL